MGRTITPKYIVTVKHSRRRAELLQVPEMKFQPCPLCCALLGKALGPAIDCPNYFGVARVSVHSATGEQ